MRVVVELKVRLAAVMVAIAAASLLAGCAELLGSPGAQPVVVQQGVPADEVAPVEEAPAAQWHCYWDPTINDDWHDDYLCSNGLAFDRPYLIPEDSFVERNEIDQAAAEYEAQLNS